ncbi:type VI secretion system tip protein VgrG [Algoriphagus winogradskyi]|uniref:Rhs element Vgr protein n=1 Tax=Algoriphagus winogradskyi TaxID=237017 RepID=A0ABY1P7G7_9BACT|nr:type VI secretion system tip protein VgrG [Algoriphagus winogradskyi]SMP27560.1 Rhs element Vgr protein [Algoriphagus winogradskyi]
MPLVPIATQSNLDHATFKVYSEGQELPPSVGVAMIAIRKAVNKIPMAKLVLFDGDIATGEFQWSEGDLFKPGVKLKIDAGYDNREETIFEGIIIKHGLEIYTDKASRLILELRDPVIKMTVGRKNKYFFESSDSDVMEELIGKYSGLEAEVESTSLSHAEIVQYHATDWDFILSRADANGKIATTEAGKVTIQKPQTSADPIIELQYGDNVVEFEAEMDARQQYTATKGFSWDFIKQEVAEKEGANPSMDFQGDISGDDLAAVIGLESFQMQHGGLLADEELQAWTDAGLMRSRLSKIQGRVKILGDNTVKPGDMVELKGFGSRFNGKAFVSAVYHEISPNQKWFTHLGLGLDPKWVSQQYDDIIDVPAAGLVPAIKGLHIGIVTALEGDPDGENRIKIRLPLISKDEEGIWARFASPDAGNERGIYFRPEIEDEVIVSFINEDPRDPVILGMLHSSTKPSPFEEKDDNHEKGIVTRDKLKLLFDDDKKTISIETPNGNKILLTDDEGAILLEDENGNKISMNSDGITIESAKDLILKASGDVSIEGTGVEVKASAQLKAEGSAGAEVSSGGQTVISGSLVQIN